MDIDEILHLLEHDPESVIRLPEVRAPGVFDAWIRRVLELTSASPREDLRHVKTAKGITVTSCDVVQCFGVEAAVRRNLGEIDKAEEALEHATELGRNCVACEADLLRRRALLLATAGDQQAALANADEAIEAYKSLPVDVDHDLFWNGLADSFLGRGTIRQFFGFGTCDDWLVQAAVSDFGEALALANPQEHQHVHFEGLLNLGVVLRKAGGLANLLTAEDYISQAWKAFKGRNGVRSRERAYLDWQTSMVRFELRRDPEGKKRVTHKPVQLRHQLARSRDDFLHLDLPHEAAAVTADLARMIYPKRLAIVRAMEESLFEAREALRRYTPEMQAAFRPVWDAMLAVREAADADVLSAGSMATSSLEFNAGLRATIEKLRETAEEAGGKALPCLVAWPSR